jgi:translation initiation factor IF-3
MPPPQALTLARSKGLDLVEISPTAVPPVCRIMDFGQYQYEQQKRARQAKKHQKVIEVKEIKFRPRVDEHDYQFKKKHIERFLADGDKVKATIFFRGRENAHPEIGRRILERLLAELSQEAVAENMPQKEGNTMHVILAKRSGSGPKHAAAPRPAPRPAAIVADAAAIADDAMAIDDLSIIDEFPAEDELPIEDGAEHEPEQTGE